MLARNEDIEGVVDSMRQLEDRFNYKFSYPWVFLNDEPFNDEFMRRTSILTRGNVSYGLIPQEHWVQPEWIDEHKAYAARRQMMFDGIIYGSSVSYRNMCRFNSGFFYRHPLVQQYRYYWRVEPDVRFYCNIDYDPFLKMQDDGKVYGFTMALKELKKTIPTLWQTVREYIGQNPDSIHPDNALRFLSDDYGQSYNLCHFWSNFEIADMEFWRGETYTKFFEHLDRAGGFYYERWGDAPIHSIAAGLFLPKEKLHFFSDVGYKHSVFQHCPQGEEHVRGRCWCNPQDNFGMSRRA
ncbi:glycosyltransferase family 15 protein [Sphaerobolus stellatus SS14]|uniref:Glycosyltransferase family 15 protein n=1 Tax=Sphaerobolus stellatus (strain SS14) TaxID=990650 RepID=A0A0C9V2R3_SPHS4|nr:glycosyltransferase family 15 protein [Sphaerobolus stellatus SS14]